MHIANQLPLDLRAQELAGYFWRMFVSLFIFLFWDSLANVKSFVSRSKPEPEIEIVERLAKEAASNLNSDIG